MYVSSVEHFFHVILYFTDSRLNEESQDGFEENQEIEEKPVKPSIIDEELVSMKNES